MVLANPIGGDLIPKRRGNVVTTSATEPTEALEGDIWVDTSGTPVVRVHNGVAFVSFDAYYDGIDAIENIEQVSLSTLGSMSATTLYTGTDQTLTTPVPVNKGCRIIIQAIWSTGLASGNVTAGLLLNNVAVSTPPNEYVLYSSRTSDTATYIVAEIYIPRRDKTVRAGLSRFEGTQTENTGATWTNIAHPVGAEVAIPAAALSSINWSGYCSGGGTTLQGVAWVYTIDEGD